MPQLAHMFGIMSADYVRRRGVRGAGSEGVGRADRGGEATGLVKPETL